MSQVAGAPDPRRWSALALLGTAFFMVILDGTIVFVARDHGPDRAFPLDDRPSPKDPTATRRSGSGEGSEESAPRRVS
jgi:hypothetical protein